MVAVGTAGVNLCGIAVIEVDLFVFFFSFWGGDSKCILNENIFLCGILRGFPPNQRKSLCVFSSFSFLHFLGAIFHHYEYLSISSCTCPKNPESRREEEKPPRKGKTCESFGHRSNNGSHIRICISVEIFVIHQRHPYTPRYVASSSGRTPCNLARR